MIWSNPRATWSRVSRSVCPFGFCLSPHMETESALWATVQYLTTFIVKRKQKVFFCSFGISHGLFCGPLSYHWALLGSLHCLFCIPSLQEFMYIGKIPLQLLSRLDRPSSLRREGTSGEIPPLGEMLQSLCVPALVSLHLTLCPAGAAEPRAGASTQTGVPAAPRGRMPSLTCSQCRSSRSPGCRWFSLPQGCIAGLCSACLTPRALSAETLWHLG